MLSDPLFGVLAFMGVVLTGISKSGFAGGAGVLAVPLMALLIPPATAVVIMLPLLLLMDAQTMSYHRRKLAVDELWVLLPAALLGVLLGSFLLGQLSDALLRAVMGTVAISFALLQLAPPGQMTKSSRKRPIFGAVMGLLAGLSSSLIHAGGPPLNMYLASRRLARRLWISTAAAFFASINLSKAISYAWVDLWQWEHLLLSLLLAPAALFGVYVGNQVQQRISEKAFMQIVMFGLLVSGASLLVTSAQ